MKAANMDAMLSSVAEWMNTGALKALVDLRASPQELERIQWLGDRANEGSLTSEEKQEHQSSVIFANFLGILQSKAHQERQAAG